MIFTRPTIKTTVVAVNQLSATMRFSDQRLSADGKQLFFEIDDVHVSVVNALRRSILSDVPTAAFRFDPSMPQNVNGILINKNSSPIHNEMLGHRLSIVPIHFDEEGLRLFSDDEARLKFIINVQNDSSDTIDVTTKDIQVIDSHTGEPVATVIRNRLFPSDPLTGDHILLTKLPPSSPMSDLKSEIDIECKASIGTGIEHARWCPVSVCFFTNALDDDAADEFYSKLPESKPSRAQFDSLQAKRFYKKNEFGVANSFEFHLESECGLGAVTLVNEGLRALQNRVRNLRAAIEGRDATKVLIVSSSDVAKAKNDSTSMAHISSIGDSDEGMFDIIVSHEDHTVGNLVQSLLFEKNFRSREMQEAIYIGYHQPHPLEHCIVFRIRLQESSPSAIEAYMVRGLLHVEKILEDLLEEWMSFQKNEK